MPIMSAQQKNDARGTGRQLALAASDSIRNPQPISGYAGGCAEQHVSAVRGVSSHRVLRIGAVT
jgi:hypothetical protein